MHSAFPLSARKWLRRGSRRRKARYCEVAAALYFEKKRRVRDSDGCACEPQLPAKRRSRFSGGTGRKNSSRTEPGAPDDLIMRSALWKWRATCTTPFPLREYVKFRRRRNPVALAFTHLHSRIDIADFNGEGTEKKGLRTWARARGCVFPRAIPRVI